MEAVARLLERWGISDAYKYHIVQSGDEGKGDAAELCVYLSKPKTRRPVAPVYVRLNVTVEPSGGVHYRLEDERFRRNAERYPLTLQTVDALARQKASLCASNHVLRGIVRDDFIDDRVREREEAEARELQMRIDIEEKYAQSEQQLKEKAEQVQVIESALIEQFRLADADGNGVLSTREFYDCMMGTNLGLDRDDVLALMAEADENEDGRIDYREFVPMAVDLVETMIAAQVAKDEMKERRQLIENQCLDALYGGEIQSILDAVYVAVEEHDADGSGRITRHQFKQSLSKRSVGLTNAEVNIAMALAPPDADDPSLINVGEIGTLIIEVRTCTLRASLLMATSSRLEKELLRGCERVEERSRGTSTGWISRADFRQVLGHMKEVRLTMMQIFSVLSTAPTDDQTGLLFFPTFVGEAASIIEQMYDSEVLGEKLNLIKRAELSPVELLGGRDRAVLEQDLQRMFLDCDSNGNGTLEPQEFRACLHRLQLGLSDYAIDSLMVYADTDNSNTVEYAEFMDFAFDYILHELREKALRETVFSSPQ